MALGRVLRLRGGDVFANLACEDALFRRGGAHALLFYVNRGCAVLGRTQNPFVELDVAHAAAAGLSIARRRSGGGCVVHDAGNLNFCFVRPRADHSALENAQLVAGVLRDAFGVPAEVNKRADIVVAGKKISGAAYRIAGDRAYHHGTLLVRSDLNSLRKVLRAPLRDRIVALGTKSVPSPVANIADFAPDVTIDDVVAAVAERYAGGDVQVRDVGIQDVERAVGGVEEERKMLASHAWVYGQIPRFSYQDSVEGGLAVAIEMSKGAVLKSVEVSEAGGRLSPEGLLFVNTMAAELESCLFDGAVLGKRLEAVGKQYANGAYGRMMDEMAAMLRAEVPSQFSRQHK